MNKSASHQSKPLLDFRIDIPIDREAVLNTMGTQKTFLMMLGKFEAMTLAPILKSLAEILDKQEGDAAENALAFKNKMHQLKGAASYMGVGVVYYASNQVQICYLANKFDEMYAYYQSVMEAALSVLLEIDRYIPPKGNQMELTSRVPLAKKFKWVIKDGEYLCCTDSQTSAQRI